MSPPYSFVPPLTVRVLYSYVPSLTVRVLFSIISFLLKGPLPRVVSPIEPP